jgi:hypothetical protein
VALIALVVYHVVFFFPTLFMRRVVSPNDVFCNFDPWHSVRSVEVQNSLLNDPPTSYLTVMSLVKGDWRAFHWNPFVASGIPGFGSSAAAVLSPFILLPTLVLPLPWIYTGIILLKLNIAFWFAYAWLREERLGKGAAAVGAIVFAASGAMAVRWLWQTTNAAALYPALLWAVRRAATGKRIPLWIAALIALAYALSGFPAAMAYGAYLAAAYFIFLIIRERRIAWRPVASAATAAALALMIAAPSLAPFVQFVRRTGYLAVRANAAIQFSFPPRHFLSFIQPDRLGNPVYHNWNGDRALGLLNNYIEATVYLGLITIPLVLLAIANRRARSRWFWLATAAVMLACMFGVMPLVRVVGEWPGFKYSSLTRLQIMLPVAAAYLAAAGTARIARRIWIASLIAVLAAGDLAVFAGRFYPYLETSIATPPMTPMLAFLQAQQKPFRIAPSFLYLWPNTSELVQLEDVRSHFSSEARYRQLLQRIDPSSPPSNSTVITFDTRYFNFTDPLVSMLGIRYFIENRDIDIIKWTTFKYTVPAVKETGVITLVPGTVLQRQIPIDTEPFYAIELPVSVEKVTVKTPRIVVSLMRGATVLYARAFTPADTAVVGKLYIPVRPFARHGETLLLRVQSIGVRAGLLRGIASSGDSPLFYGRVNVPVVFDRELPDGRLFRNLGEVPRFHSVSRLRKMNDAVFLATKDIDFAQEAIITDAAAAIPPSGAAGVALRSYAEDEQHIEVRAAAPAFLASSEKLTPELRITIDGRKVQPVEINMMFAGVPVPAGTHQVVFSRRIGRGWWWLSAAALIVAVALSIIDGWRR